MLGCSVSIREFWMHTKHSPAPAHSDLNIGEPILGGFFSLSNIEVKAEMEKFPHGIKIFGRKREIMSLLVYGDVLL